MKKINFVCGLPRSGSTLLMNILGQNEKVGVTPTSSLLEQVINIKNNWDTSPLNQAIDWNVSNTKKLNVLKSIFHGYFLDQPNEIIFDKNRGWLHQIEMVKNLFPDSKFIVCVRDVRDILSSFEKIYRKSLAIQAPVSQKNKYLQSQTALGRIEILIDAEGLVGDPYNSIKDAITRGWKKDILFVDFNDLTKTPEQTLSRIYDFIEEESFKHNFNDVRQLTHEDDSIHGFYPNALHTIKSTVNPVPSSWNEVYDSTVTNTTLWKQIEADCFFWKNI